MAQLESVSLTNFQTFAETVEIPFGRVTLLFGPNSAGKSAVFDAIGILCGMLASFAKTAHQSPSEYPSLERVVDFDDWKSRLCHDARRPANERRDPHSSLDGRASISARLSLNSLSTAVALGTYRHRSGCVDRIAELDVEFTLAILPPWAAEDCLANWPVSFDVRVDGRMLLRFVEHTSLALDYGHPLLRPLKLRQDSLGKLLALDQARLSKKGTTYEWRLDAMFTSGYLEIGMMKDAFEGDLDAGEYGEGDIGRRYARLAENAFDDFGVTFQRLTGILCTQMLACCDSTMVDASRRVPKPEELSYMLAHWSGFTERTVVSGASVDGNPKYERLAKGLFSEWWHALNASARLDGSTEHDVPENESLHTRVNRALSESLFVERLYQCCVEVNVLLPGDWVKKIPSREPLTLNHLEGLSCLVRLKLRDGEGRCLDFVDVGSGLGYLLPVLVGLFDSDNKVQVLIQQPELHLHPALQASLGDVVLEATSEGSSAVIETHSEHLLLRLLRRVRQSARPGGTAPAGMSLRPDQLVVLYFDPQVAGQTRVKRLRVSEDGDFLDRWPRGFFDDRDKELFGDGSVFDDE